MSRGDAPCDRQPQAGPARVAGPRGIGANERLEQVRQACGVDSRTRVTHRKPHDIALTLESRGRRHIHREGRHLAPCGGTAAPDSRVSNGEINRELTALKRSFNLAIQAGKLLQKPHIPFLKEDNVRVGFFERDQFLAVLARLPEPVQPAATFAYITGWRIDGEVLSLEWRQVDFGADEVRLDPGKTKNGEGRTSR